MALNDVKPAGVYKAKDVSGPLKEYDAMRARVGQRVGADTQQQQDAMQRRFAAQGGLNSGAAIKQQQLVAESGVQQREQAIEGVDAQETAERRRLQEAEAQKEYQSQEAETGRQFAAGESKLGRDFTAGESKLGRDAQRGMFDDDMKFKDKVATWENAARGEQLKMAWEQLGLAKQESAFNQAAAAAQMDDDEREWVGQAQGGNFNLNAAREQIAYNKMLQEQGRKRQDDEKYKEFRGY
jgi:hypothetical protein